MIAAKDAIAAARALLGTPYREMDCIALIREVIRRSAGGEKDYRCEGTNWLWRSAKNSRKYRHLLWRQEGTQGARAGMLAFKRNGEDVHHIGLVTPEETVIHASSVYGCAVETPLDETWHLLAVHRDIEPAHEGDAQQPVNSEEGDQAREFTSLVRSDGVSVMLCGSWRVVQD